jgi:hypothetical protein
VRGAILLWGKIYYIADFIPQAGKKLLFSHFSLGNSYYGGNYFIYNTGR